jgi:hypothetical protein
MRRGGNVKLVLIRRVQVDLNKNYSVEEMPPQKEWVGLTEEEVKDFQVNKFVGPNLIRAIERRLKEKNSGQR